MAADGQWVRRSARTVADGLGATDWLEMVWEKKPLVMSELCCADGCGRQMGGENCVDSCGRRGCQGVAGNGRGEETAGDQRAWLRGRLQKWVRRIARTAADGVGAREWLEMGGEEKPLVMSELGCAHGCGREMGADNCAGGCGRLRTAADGVGAREWLEMGGEKKPLVMSELGFADGCGRQMGWENCADGCRRRGCEGVAGNGWGEEGAGDERAWLRGTAADGKWVGRIARMAADGVGARG